MKTFNVKMQREFDVEFEATSIHSAEVLAQLILSQFPTGKAKLVSIEEDRAKTAAAPCA